ncbi:MAG: glutaredoxin family protein [Candidatus Neomarinimicrobiota bacterium]
MSNQVGPRIPVPVTLLWHPECPTCQDLLVELEPLRSAPEVRIEVIDITAQATPAFAQPLIVPATYVGKQLWRYGKFPLQALRRRLRRELHGSSDD